MSSEYCHQVLKICVAQLCQNLGWTSTQSTPLEILTDILERYLVEVGKVTHRYAEQFGRTEPSVDDIGLAFRHLNVSPGELREFIENTDPIPYAHDIVAFPAPKRVNLQFPRPDCREVVTRDEYIPEHMPLIHPELEEEEQPTLSGPIIDTVQTGLLPLPTVTPASTSPVPDLTNVDKPTSTPDGPPFKRRRLDSGALPEEAGPSLYEMKSVVISTTGDLTPTHGKAGKLPDPRTPPQKKVKDSPKTSPIKIPKKSDKEKAESMKERIEKDLFSDPVNLYEKKGKEEVVIVRPKSAVKSPPVASPALPKRPPGRPPKSPGVSRPTLKKSPGRPPMQKSPGRPPLSRSPGRSMFQRSPGRPPLHRSPSRPHPGRSPGRPPKSPRGRPRGFMPLSTRTHPPADIDKIERNILERLSPQRQSSDESKDIPSTPTSDQPLDFSLPAKSTDSVSVKSEDVDENSQDDLSKLIIAEPAPKGRGRPPISPEKKMARLAAIDDIIQSVIEKSANKKEDDVDIKQESSQSLEEGETFDAYITNVDLDDMASEVVSEVEVKTETNDNSGMTSPNITLPSGEKLPPLPPSSYGSAQKRPKGRPKGSGKKKLTGTPSKEKPSVLSETVSQVNIVENKPAVKAEPKSPMKAPLDPWQAAMSAAGLSVSVRPPEPEEDTMPATFMDVVGEVEVGGESVEIKSELLTEASSESVELKREPGETSKEGTRVKEKSERSKEHKKKKEKKKKNKNKDKDKERSKKDKNKDEYYPKIKIKLGGPSKTCESVIMSPRPDSSPSESPRQEGLKLVIKTFPQKTTSEIKPSSPSVSKKEPKVKTEKPFRPSLKEEGPPVLSPEPPKTATPPPPVLKVPSPVPPKHASTLSFPQLPRGVNPSPPPPNLSHPSTSRDHSNKFPSPARTEIKSSPALTRSTPPFSPDRGPESPIEQVNSPHSDTPSTSPYHSPSPSPGPSQPKEMVPPMPPPSIVPPPPPPSKPSVQRTVVAETIGTFIDATGQKVWICPTCKMPDDGSPMIGCDICDDWYHWVCVGIKEDPPEDQSWYCSKCLAPSKKPSKRGRKKGSGMGRGRGKKLA